MAEVIPKSIFHIFHGHQEIKMKMCVMGHVLYYCRYFKWFLFNFKRFSGNIRCRKVFFRSCFRNHHRVRLLQCSFCIPRKNRLWKDIEESGIGVNDFIFIYKFIFLLHQFTALTCIDACIFFYLWIILLQGYPIGSLATQRFNWLPPNFISASTR